MYHYREGSSSQCGGYGGGSQYGGYGGGSSFAYEGPTELLALGTRTGEMAIFNLAANAMVAQHQIAGGHRIGDVKFSNDGQRVYATNDRRLYEFSAEDLALRVRHVKFSDDGQKVYATNNRRLYEFSAENLTLRAYFQDQGHIADFSLNLDEHALYTCSSGAIKTWDSSGELAAEYTRRGDIVRALPINLGANITAIDYFSWFTIL